MASKSQGLPVAEPEVVSSLLNDYTAASRSGKGVAEAAMRLAWAYVHSSSSADQQKGVDLCYRIMSMHEAHSDDIQLEVLYLLAVGKFRQGRLAEARQQVDELLKMHPQHRQAQALREMIESQMVKEGLIGVGIGAAVLTGLGAIAVGLLIGGKR